MSIGIWLKAEEEQPVRQNEIAGDKGNNHRGEEPGLFAQGFEPPPRCQRIDPQQQTQRRGRLRLYGQRGQH